jgi:hypothetical protein
LDTAAIDTNTAAANTTVREQVEADVGAVVVLASGEAAFGVAVSLRVDVAAKVEAAQQVFSTAVGLGISRRVDARGVAVEAWRRPVPCCQHSPVLFRAPNGIVLLHGEAMIGHLTLERTSHNSWRLHNARAFHGQLDDQNRYEGLRVT